MKVTEIFRLKGIPIAESYVSSHVGIYVNFIALKACILNKEQLNELINWLISKLDEM